MTTLHMNTDQARAAVSAMRNAASEIQSALNAANGSVGALQGEWMGNSAAQFGSEYDNWRNALNNALSALEALTARLEGEISEWEAAAQSL